jgi:uncharacterized protein involved in exopolysaccharide biosynthesis
MQQTESRNLLPTRREVFARIFRQRTVFLVCFLLVVAGFILSGQFEGKYKADMRILVRKERVDPVLTAGQNSQPELISLDVTEDDLNSEVELLKSDDLLSDVVVKAGLVPKGPADPVAVARALRKMKKKLDISTIAKTDLISVNYTSPDASEVMRVLQAFEADYPSKQQSVKGNDFQTNFFAQQRDEKLKALNGASQKLADFTEKTHVVSAGLQRDLVVHQMSALDQDMQENAADIANLQGRRATLATQLAVEQPRVTTETQSRDNPELLQQANTNLLNLEDRRTKLLNEFEPGYRAVTDIDKEIKTTQDFIAAQKTNPVGEKSENINPVWQGLHSELNETNAQLIGLQKKQAALKNSITDMEQSAADFAAEDPTQQKLLDDVKDAQDQYTLFNQKYEQAQMTHVLDTKGFLNVAVAQEPVAPALPEHSFVGVFAVMLFTAFLLSIGFAFLFDLFDPTVRNVTELSEVSAVPVLAEFGHDIYFERGY